MQLSYFKKKPVAVPGILVHKANLIAIKEWLGDAYNGHVDEEVFPEETGAKQTPFKVRIKNSTGNLTAVSGDYILQDSKGEFYPCPADVFAGTYEPTHDPNELRPWTAGEKYFGCDFNPGNRNDVAVIKKHFADVYDLLQDIIVNKNKIVNDAYFADQKAQGDAYKQQQAELAKEKQGEENDQLSQSGNTCSFPPSQEVLDLEKNLFQLTKFAQDAIDEMHLAQMLAVKAVTRLKE